MGVSDALAPTCIGGIYPCTAIAWFDGDVTQPKEVCALKQRTSPRGRCGIIQAFNYHVVLLEIARIQ
jgi:hypothetical protein